MAITLNGTTGIASVDASVSAPSVRGTDGNTGVSYGADSIKFSTGGVERMAISNSGVTGVGGKILQIVQGTPTTTELQTSSTSLVDVTGLNCTITPTATTSHFIIHSSLSYLINYGSGSNMGFIPALIRGSTEIFGGMDQASGAATEVFWQPGGGNPDYLSGRYNNTWYDDPNLSDTSAITYKMQVMVQNGSGTGYFNFDAAVDGKSWMIIYEVAAT